MKQMCNTDIAGKKMVKLKTLSEQLPIATV